MFSLRKKQRLLPDDVRGGSSSLQTMRMQSNLDLDKAKVNIYVKKAEEEIYASLCSTALLMFVFLFLLFEIPLNGYFKKKKKKKQMAYAAVTVYSLNKDLFWY